MFFLTCLLGGLSYATVIMSLADLSLAQTCSKLAPAGLANKRLNWYVVSHLLDFSLDRCALECILVKRCASFNYRERLGICELSSVTAEDVENPDMEHEAEGFVYHVISNWSWELAGSCSSRPCAENQRCIQIQPFICADVDCGVPPVGLLHYPPYTFHVTGQAASTSVGDIAVYSCNSRLATIAYNSYGDIPFYNNMDKICNSDYTWTDNSIICYLTGLVTCEDVKACNPSYPDGHYWIYMRGQHFSKIKVYCHDMANDANTYITLPSADNIAYNAGDGITGPTMTKFSKIRIDRQFNVDRSDFTFATSTGPLGNISFGDSGSCYGNANNKVYGYFRISTAGTGVWITESENTWTAAATGGSELVNLTYSLARGEVNGLCWGTCGTCAPTTPYLRLSWSFLDSIDGSDTVQPVCY